ncbi:MAG: C2 family cysteine protease [Gemmataceae bacterium]
MSPRKPRWAPLQLMALESRVTPSVAALPDDPYENNDTPARAYSLGTLTGTRALYDLRLNDSADWFSFSTVQTGSILDQVVLEYDITRGNLDLEVFDSSMNLVGRSSDTGNYENVFLTGAAPGTYFVKVLGKNGATNPHYTLFVQAPLAPLPDDPYEDNDSFNQAFSLGAVQGTTTIPGLKLQDGSDWFSFQTLAPGTDSDAVSITFTLKQGAVGDLTLTLYDDQGLEVATANGPGSAERISLQGLPAGIYFAQITSTYGNKLAGRYTLSITGPEPGDDAHEDNDTAKRAAPLGWLTGQTTLSNLKLNDRADWFSFVLNAAGKKGDTAQITTTSGGPALRLELTDANGKHRRDGKVQGDTTTVSLEGLAVGVTYKLRIYRAKHVSAGGASYQLVINPPKVTDWYTQNLTDRRLAKVVQLAMKDGVISRSDMISVLDLVGEDGSVSARELASLRLVVRNPTTIQMPDYVRYLSQQVVLGNQANKFFQGLPLGNLVAGSTAQQLNNLVAKWFLGQERPGTASTRGAAPSATPYPYFYYPGTLFGDMVWITPPSFPDCPEYYVLPVPPTPAQPTPLPTNIHQGYLGDCYFLSTLASTAQQDPSRIQDLFVDASDGVYTVRFFVHGADGTYRTAYVTVDQFLPTLVTDGTSPYQGNQVPPGVGGNNILWAGLLEKAYAIFQQTGGTQPNGAQGINRFRYQGMSGGYANAVMSQLYGQAAVSKDVDASLTFAEIVAAFDAGGPVVFGTDQPKDTKCVVDGHDYAMLGYDLATEKILLLNPWGVGTSVDMPPTLLVDMAFLQANWADWFHLKSAPVI